MDRDVLAWLKAQGRGYQTRINAILRAHGEGHVGELDTSHLAFRNGCPDQSNQPTQPGHKRRHRAQDPDGGVDCRRARGRTVELRNQPKQDQRHQTDRQQTETEVAQEIQVIRSRGAGSPFHGTAGEPDEQDRAVDEKPAEPDIAEQAQRTWSAVGVVAKP